MKRTAFVLLAGIIAATAPVVVSAQSEYSGTDPLGVLSYSLPSTTISFEVEAVRECFYAGPYAKFASKYLGIEAGQTDRTTYQLTNVKMTPYVEADHSKRFIYNPAGEAVSASVLKLTSAGLITSADESFGHEQTWRFPVKTGGTFADKGVSANLTTEAATLYKGQKKGAAYDKVAVRQDMVVEKSVEKKAAEAADMIFRLREKRLQIVTGDTDATYSGEAMGAAIAEISKLEKEYMMMFTGYSEYQSQKMSFDVVPEKDRESQIYVAFRLSDAAGLLPADNVSGKPVILEIVPQTFAKPETDRRTEKGNKVPSVVYRIPASCSVRLLNGTEVLMQSRIQIYQLGEESTMPVNVKTK